MILGLVVLSEGFQRCGLKQLSQPSATIIPVSQPLHLPQASQANPFADQLITDGQQLVRDELTTLQLNIGKMCNLACEHCHVESSPARTEIMTWQTMQKILDWIDSYRQRGQLDLKVVDLTGGAPEMNPHFCRLVEALRARDLHVLDRCNLTILLEPGYENMIAFLAEHRVEIVASLPCYLQENVDAQRGKGVYDKSIEALRQLNVAGFGTADNELRLDLVFNPVGYGLPPDEASLETEYKRELKNRFDIDFNRLWTITNMPIKRFEHALRRDRMYDIYVDRLMEAHNPQNVANVMCRSLVSVGWQGAVYDCDFNQMLQMPLQGPQLGDEHIVEQQSRKLWQYTPAELVGRSIATAGHCFGCTAGAGSSCTGALGNQPASS